MDSSSLPAVTGPAISQAASTPQSGVPSQLPPPFPKTPPHSDSGSGSPGGSEGVLIPGLPALVLENKALCECASAVDPWNAPYGQIGKSWEIVARELNKRGYFSEPPRNGMWVRQRLNAMIDFYKDNFSRDGDVGERLRSRTLPCNRFGFTAVTFSMLAAPLEKCAARREASMQKKWSSVRLQL
jgi:hypothetical protein